MFGSFLFRLAVLCSLGLLSHACPEVVALRGSAAPLKMGRLSLEGKSALLHQHPEYADSGRAIYSSEKGLWLYHCQDTSSGEGRWEIGTSFCTGTNTDGGEVAAYALSWAVAPHLIEAASDGGNDIWKVSESVDALLDGLSPSGEATYITADDSFRITCAVPDVEASPGVVYFESSARMQPGLAGFYIQHSVSDADDKVVYTQVKESPADQQMYLFSLPSTQQCDDLQTGVCSHHTTWLIGDRYGVDAGLAFTNTVVSHSTSAGSADIAALTSQPPLSQSMQRWDFVDSDQDNRWVQDSAAVLYAGNSQDDVYTVLRNARGIHTLPAGQTLMKLRNGYGMPQIGLGTGGIYLEEAADVFTAALRQGYRLLDLAREYGNEHIVPQVLDALAAETAAAEEDAHAGSRHSHSHSNNDVLGGNGEGQEGSGTGSGLYISRNDVFLETKVWPTQLGFRPTSRAVLASLRQLRTNYVDLYLLHWPSCDASIEWMHCETTEEAGATWRESYWALQRAYAEGRVMAIGVSNFDAPLLAQLISSESTLVLPHVVQNWAEPGRSDAGVRQLCARHGTLYQPYAPLRNLQFLPAALRQALRNIGRRRGVSEHAVALRYFVQLGATVIPRSRSWEHLSENLAVTSWALDAAEMQQLADRM